MISLNIQSNLIKKYQSQIVGKNNSLNILDLFIEFTLKMKSLENAA